MPDQPPTKVPATSIRDGTVVRPMNSMSPTVTSPGPGGTVVVASLTDVADVFAGDVAGTVVSTSLASPSDESRVSRMTSPTATTAARARPPTTAHRRHEGGSDPAGADGGASAAANLAAPRATTSLGWASTRTGVSRA